MKIYTDRKYQKEKYCQILLLLNLKQVIERPIKFRKYSQWKKKKERKLITL